MSRKEAEAYWELKLLFLGLDDFLQDLDGTRVGHALKGRVRDLLQPRNRPRVHLLVYELQVRPATKHHSFVVHA